MKYHNSASNGNSIQATAAEQVLKTKPKSTSIVAESMCNAAGQALKKSSKSASVAAKSMPSDDNGLLDEDDSIERATILQSSAKGVKCLSSAVSHRLITQRSFYYFVFLLQSIVKIEKLTSSSSKLTNSKSHSKETILGSHDVVFVWNKFIEPTFAYWFFYELAPWPSTKDIVSCT